MRSATACPEICPRNRGNFQLIWRICTAVQLHTGPLDVGQEGGVMNRGQPGEIDHPWQQQVIEIGIDADQGGGADSGADQGEINIGGGAMATQGPGAVQDGGLHLGVAGEHLTDGRDRRFRQAGGLG